MHLADETLWEAGFFVDDNANFPHRENVGSLGFDEGGEMIIENLAAAAMVVFVGWNSDEIIVEELDFDLIRILDGIGALLYVFYGVLIHSYANILLNVVLVAVQVYHLTKLRRAEQVQIQDKE